MEGSLSGDCDVEKNGKWSCIYTVGSQEYQVVCTRPDIASAGVDMSDGFDRGLQTNVQVFVDFDNAMSRSITVYGLMILGCAGSLKANLQHMEALSIGQFLQHWIFLADARLRSGIPNEKLVQTLLKGHSILSLEDSLSRDCDVKKNGKWSYIYAVGSQEYQVICTRPDIASADVDMLDGFDRRLQLNVQVFVDFDHAMGRSITVMSRSITGYGLMILGCAGSLKANLQYMEALSTTEAGYMTFTEAWKKKIWLKGLLTGAGLQEVQTQELMDYQLARDREQHLACELFGYREDSNEAAFVVAAVEKIYAHESLTFNYIVACEVISKWKAGLTDDMDARSDVYVLSNGRRKCSDDDDGYYWEYTPGDCDVEKNGKWSCIYAVGSQEYQVVCMRLDIELADVGILDKFNHRL
ncbi:hypothetical protein Tco_0871953 [Tanacetum coccineum]